MPFRSRRRPVATDRRFRKKTEHADHGTPERWQHSGRVLESTEKAGVQAARATEEHIVDVLVLRGLLTVNHRAAALKFKLDYHRAGLASHVTGSYSLTRGNQDYFRGLRERSDFEEAAYRRWRNAVRELGLRLGGVVVATACHDLSPAARDVPLLQKGLEKLADWYRLPT